MRSSRSGLLLVLFAAGLVVVLVPQLPRSVRDLRGPSFPDALLGLGSLLAVGLAAWVLLIAGLVSVGVSSRIVARLTPPLLRGVLLAGLAGTLAIGPAQAAQVAGSDTRRSVSGLPLPDRPDAHASAARASMSQAVEVRPGDTLWAIAARSLPAGAADAQIAAATRAWHRANREVIGADPNLIFPTQRLVPPTVKDLS